MVRRSVAIGLIVAIVFVLGALSERFVGSRSASSLGTHAVATPTRTAVATATLARDTSTAVPTTAPATITTVPTTAPTATATNPPSTPQPRPTPHVTSGASTSDAASVLRAYYSAVNHHDYARAYHDILPRDRPPYAGFVQAYAATQAATLVKLIPAKYLNVANGRAATCVGFELTAHNKNAPPTAYGGWYMMESTTGQSPHFAGWQIVESGTHSLLNGAATVPPQDTCFPPSTFVLPARGSATTIIALSSKDLPGPVKPMRRTEYDLAQSPFFYRVDVFNSLSDAASSYQWQAGTLSHLIPINHPATVGERLYQTGNFLIATLLSHNVEYFVNEQVAPNAHATPQDIASLLSLAQRLSEETRSGLSAPATTPIPTPTNTPEPTPTTSAATPVHAVSGKQQMVALEKQLDTLTHDCQNDFGIVGYLLDHVLSGNPSESVNSMELDTQYGIDSCNTAQSRVDAIRLSSPLNQYSLVHRLLSAEHTEMFDSAVTAIEFQRYLTSGDSGALNATEYAYKGTVNQDVPAVSSIRTQINTLFGITPPK